MPRYKVMRTTIISEEETKQMVDMTSSLKDKAMLSFLYLFGARPSELRTLIRSDFHIKDEKLWVSIDTKKTRQREGKTPIVNTKRPIWTPLTESLSRNIISYLETCEHGVLVFNYGSSDKVANVIIDRKIKSVNPNCCAYIFRHTRNTILARNGATDPQLVAWNGWSDSRPAGRYVHNSPELVKDIPQKKEEPTNSV